MTHIVLRPLGPVCTSSLSVLPKCALETELICERTPERESVDTPGCRAVLGNTLTTMSTARLVYAGAHHTEHKHKVCHMSTL